MSERMVLVSRVPIVKADAGGNEEEKILDSNYYEGSAE